MANANRSHLTFFGLLALASQFAMAASSESTSTVSQTPALMDHDKEMALALSACPTPYALIIVPVGAHNGPHSMPSINEVR
jgi:hypothetical protein